ncbi:MAG: alpha/beta fold hydrolase [Bacillota bacterium]
MRRARSIALCLSVVVMALFLTVCGKAETASAGTADAREIYYVTTTDGIVLAMKRYRPDSNASMNIGKQPVILMPGLTANINYFDIRTPAGENYNVKLPANLASWAAGDPYIQADPMKYYSLPYYLWKQGYDVWLANYRGQGRYPVKSGGRYGYAIDELGIYDMPAIVKKVYEVTGKHPVWIGHSMGSTMAYMYLQGAKFRVASYADSHVVSDSALVAERNNGTGKQALKGLVDLDGPVIPVGSPPSIFDAAIWTALSVPSYVDLQLLSSLGLTGITGLVDFSSSTNANNIDKNVADYIQKYAVDGFSTRTAAQYGDASTNKKLREDYKNGNPLLVFPPKPRTGDGYYYYSDNLSKISLPTLIIADSTVDITDPNDIQNFYNKKSRNAKDAFYIIPGTAHVDLVVGLNAPTELYPKIGHWLESLQ